MEKKEHEKESEESKLFSVVFLLKITFSRQTEKYVSVA